MFAAIKWTPALRRRSTTACRPPAAFWNRSPAIPPMVPESSALRKSPAISSPVRVPVSGGAYESSRRATNSDAVEITVLGEESFFGHTLRRRAVGRFIGCAARGIRRGLEETLCQKTSARYHHETVKKVSLISYGYRSSRPAGTHTRSRPSFERTQLMPRVIVALGKLPTMLNRTTPTLRNPLSTRHSADPGKHASGLEGKRGGRAGPTGSGA